MDNDIGKKWTFVIDYNGVLKIELPPGVEVENVEPRRWRTDDGGTVIIIGNLGLDFMKPLPPPPPPPPPIEPPFRLILEEGVVKIEVLPEYIVVNDFHISNIPPQE